MNDSPNSSHQRRLSRELDDATERGPNVDDLIRNVGAMRPDEADCGTAVGVGVRARLYADGWASRHEGLCDQFADRRFGDAEHMPPALNRCLSRPPHSIRRDGFPLQPATCP